MTTPVQVNLGDDETILVGPIPSTAGGYYDAAGHTATLYVKADRSASDASGTAVGGVLSGSLANGFYFSFTLSAALLAAAAMKWVHVVAVAPGGARSTLLSRALVITEGEPSNGAVVFTPVALAVRLDSEISARVAAGTAGVRREQIDSAADYYGDFANLDGLIPQANATVVAGRFASTASGTLADAIMPLYGPIRSCRWSFVVKADKTGVALARSTVGFTVGTEPGALPTPAGATGYAVGVGYIQGTGICWQLDNLGGATVLVADASLVDQAEYVIEAGFDYDLSNGSASGFGAYMYANVRTLAGVLVVSGSKQAYPTLFMSNLLLRTSSSAGNIRAVAFKAHAAGRLLRNRPFISTPIFYNDANVQAVIARFPAVPLRPYRVAVWCHGSGQSPFFSGAAGSVENPLVEALERAGFITVIHNFHGNVWGADIAHSDLLTLYNNIVARYGPDTQFFLIGESMGAALAASVVAKATIPVRAVVCIDGVFDLAWTRTQAAYTASIDAAYPGGAATYNNPVGYAAAAYGTVPFWISASAGDVTILKANNSDAFKALLGNQVTEVVTTGTHVAASHFSTPAAMVNFLIATFA